MNPSLHHLALAARGVLVALLVLVSGCRSTNTADGESDDADSHGGYLVDMDDVQSASYESIEELLIARVPGVRRAPDGHGIVIRGPRSLQGSSNPLYVVDGLPLVTSPQLNLYDVALIEVVSDVAALSRYGSRGMHGVVYIRTKKAGD